MPNKDGYQATREIRDTLRLDLPVIAMTANASIGERDRGAAAGMSDLLVKPFGARELAENLSRHLSRPRVDAAAEPVAVPESNEPLLDRQVFQSLLKRFAHRPGTTERLFNALKESIDMHLTSLADAVQQPAAKLTPILHAMKGSAGMYGARRLQVTAVLLEQELLGGRPPAELGAGFAQLDSVGRRTVAGVRDLLEELASGAYRQLD